MEPSERPDISMVMSRVVACGNMQGDESHIGESVVPIAIPARTGIAEVQVYEVQQGTPQVDTNGFAKESVA
ncbi:hypothetical protein RAB80_018037 [Fusarium oxysporum f. sp. vasinfectum]|nr:hypothetical protein RAB80_018037 [Fusarium oxysporum f. sp. vasinfectum]